MGRATVVANVNVSLSALRLDERTPSDMKVEKTCLLMVACPGEDVALKPTVEAVHRWDVFPDIKCRYQLALYGSC